MSGVCTSFALLIVDTKIKNSHIGTSTNPRKVVHEVGSVASGMFIDRTSYTMISSLTVVSNAVAIVKETPDKW